MDLNDGGAAAGTVDDLLGGASGDAGAGAGGDQGGGGGDAGAGAGGDAGAGAGGDQGGGADPEFYGSLAKTAGDGETASNFDYVKSKGFKDLDGLVKALRFTEKGLHDSGRVKVPGEGASAEEVAAWRTAIGVPDKPEGYQVPEFKDSVGKPIALNTPMTQRVFANAHKIGLPKAAAEQLVADEIKAQIEEHDARVTELRTAAAEHVKSWGADKEGKLAQVNAAAKDAGLTPQDMEYLRGMPSGPGKMLDMLAKFGANFSEDMLIDGQRKAFGMSAEDAQKELDAIKADPERVRKAKVPGSAENQQWNRLNRAVASAAEAKLGDS